MEMVLQNELMVTGMRDNDIKITGMVKGI